MSWIRYRLYLHRLFLDGITYTHTHTHTHTHTTRYFTIHKKCIQLLTDAKYKTVTKLPLSVNNDTYVRSVYALQCCIRAYGECADAKAHTQCSHHRRYKTACRFTV